MCPDHEAEYMGGGSSAQLRYSPPAGASTRLIGPVPLLRILLFSPLRHLDPVSGDTTYTETLLSNPPPSVCYTPYDQAIRDGLVVELGRRSTATRTPSDMVAAAARGGERLLRALGGYRESTSWVRVDRSAFDLVHSHLFPLRIVGDDIPVVSTAGFPLSELYIHREGWGQVRAGMIDRVTLLWSRLIGSSFPGYRARRGGSMGVYTEHYRQWLGRRGADIRRVLLCRQGLPPADVARRPLEYHAAFIGRDYFRKGGDSAVEIFLEARRIRPDLRMALVTRSDPFHGSPPLGVSVFEDMAREMVLRLLSGTGVLLAPTRSDCGAPYGILEALRAGVPIILGRSPWLDPRLGPPAAFPYDGDSVAAAQHLVRLISDPEELRTCGVAAHQLWEQSFSTESANQDLLALYEMALECQR